MSTRVEFDELEGKTIVEINHHEDRDDVLEFICSDGSEYKQYHSQDCCESVWLEDVDGEFKDILNSPVLLADERISEEGGPDTDESGTWSFYTIRTVLGSITLRWCGQSNGYYSETVDLYRVKDPNKVCEFCGNTVCTCGASTNK